MKTIIPGQIATKDFHQFIVGAVAPRPIAFASTIDQDGVPNLAPYSFFNAFSSNPPILVFSSNRRVQDNTTKDTLRNVEQTGEVVINVVNYNMVRQMAIAGVSYPPQVSEFEKAGLTPLASEVVKPFRVKESPVHFECKVQQIVTLGDKGGAGHLILCDVVRLHIDEKVIDERGRIDPHQLDLVGRLGRAYYVRASGAALFAVHQEQDQIALGFDQLPADIRQSPYLTGNELAQMAGLYHLPSAEDVQATIQTDARLQALLSQPPSAERRQALHLYAKGYLEQEQGEYALRVLLAGLSV